MDTTTNNVSPKRFSAKNLFFASLALFLLGAVCFSLSQTLAAVLVVIGMILQFVVAAKSRQQG